eukprot:44883_1
MASLHFLLFIVAVVIICVVVYLLRYRHKLNNLDPPAQRCYHINKLPSLTDLLPKFILFSIIKPRRKPLPFCQLIAPHNVETKHQEPLIKQNPKRKVVTINALDPKSKTDDIGAIEPYEYFSGIGVTIDCFSIDPLQLVSYNKSFNMTDLEEIPLCYLSTMALRLTQYVMTNDAFPVSPFGLIRIGTEITMHERLSIAHKYEITTSLSEIRDTQNGIEIDISTVLYLMDSDDSDSYTSHSMVYECVDTWRSKYACADDIKDNEWQKEFDVNNKKNKYNVIVKQAVHIAAQTASSSDFDEYVCGHADRMWILQKCLTQIKANNKNNDKMFIYRYPIKAVTTFKQPIYAASDYEAKLVTNYYSHSNDYLTFAMISQDDTVPHLFGSIVAQQ